MKKRWHTYQYITIYRLTRTHTWELDIKERPTYYLFLSPHHMVRSWVKYGPEEQPRWNFEVFFFFFLNRNQFVMQSVQLQSYAKRSERSSDVLSWWERTGVTNHKWCVWKSTLAQQKEPIIEFLLTFTLGVSSPSWLLWVLPMHTAHCTHRPTLPPHPPLYRAHPSTAPSLPRSAYSGTKANIWDPFPPWRSSSCGVST